MNKNHVIKATIKGKDNLPVEGLKVKSYNEKGNFLSSAFTDKEGKVDFEAGIQTPKYIKFVDKGKIIHTEEVEAMAWEKGYVLDIGPVVISMIIAPADWHVSGVVRDKMSGEPLQGLTVEAWDVDQGTPTTYYDALGEDITDAGGKFNIWFDDEVFERTATGTGEIYPDILIKIKNVQGVVIHESEVDLNVTGSPHLCKGYTAHKGKAYTLDVDYVTAGLNKIGPVSTADINTSGRAVTYNGINDRPFGGNLTISGRIWGAYVSKWRLSYAAGFIDSGSPVFSGLTPTAADPFATIIEGTSQVWDGMITSWHTGSLEGLHTLVLVVWDDNGNEYHDTQIVFLHNTAITPPAQIIVPAAGSTLNKADGTSIQVQGTASDDYFYSFGLLWAGVGQTELTGSGISYPPAGNKTQVVSGNLGTWDISSLVDGPYVLRLAVHDRTIRNDGVHQMSDWTWNTLSIIS